MKDSINYQVKRFKSLQVCLKELEPFIRNGEHLRTGRPFKRFNGLRSREVLTNWLLCVVANFAWQTDRLTFTSNPLGGDGIICDSMTGETWPTEHVMVPRTRVGEGRDIETAILDAIGRKQSKGGAAYATEKTLIVFVEGGGQWFPNKIVKKLPHPLDFGAVWAVSLQSVRAGKYVYGVTHLS